MAYDLEVEKVREKLIRAYAEGLNTLSIEPLMDIFHPEFMVEYLRTDLRYIGHLAKTFVIMKLEGKTLNAEFDWMKTGTYRFPIVRLHPPIEDIFFYKKEGSNRHKKTLPPITDHDVILFCRVKDSKIFRVFYGTDNSENEDIIMQIHKPAQFVKEDNYEVERSPKVPPLNHADGYQYVVFEDLPMEQRIEWRKMFKWILCPNSPDGKLHMEYEEYEAFYEAWVNGTPCERKWFRFPNR